MTEIWTGTCQLSYFSRCPWIYVDVCYHQSVCVCACVNALTSWDVIIDTCSDWHDALHQVLIRLDWLTHELMSDVDTEEYYDDTTNDKLIQDILYGSSDDEEFDGF